MSRSKTSPALLLFFLVVIAAVAFLVYKNSPPALAPGPQQPQLRLGPADIYPDPSRTPGATDPDITQDTIGETICNPNWSTRLIRPPERYTSRLKREQIEAYGDSGTARDYEEDHLIPLELGGNPTDSRNLWPEPYVASIPDGGAHSKDKVETYLHDAVCSGSLGLTEAQREIATDWYRVYVTSVAR